MSNIDIAALADAAAEAEDQTQEVAHEDFDNTPPAGVTVGRLISYIELGKHDGGEYQGKKKPDADKVRVEFELLGPHNTKEYEKDGEKGVITQTVEITMKKSLSDKAKFKKLFKKLTYGREDKKHIAQCLGEAYILHIYHNEVTKEGGKKRVYVNLDKDGEFGISAPFQLDPITQQKKYYEVPAATRECKLFLWDNPVKELWDALFIDGVREIKKEDGTIEKKSKNWLQEWILSAKNFQGSPLHEMLTGLAHDDLPSIEETPSIPDEATHVSETSQTDLEAAIAEVEAQSPTESENPAPEASEEVPVDPMAALGLTFK